MEKTNIGFFDKSIAFCFYLLFFFVPLAMYPSSFELFEFNKMWVVFMLTIIIGFLWLSKMIYAGRIFFRRTPFDIPILLFLLSQLVSTVFSIDPYVSLWGYYSRFNGGLLSLTSYIFLYYAFAGNLINAAKVEFPERRENNQKPAKGIFSFWKNSKNFSHKILLVSLISGTIIALWGLPSHYGHDLTCLIFRGSFDVSCWTYSFHPELRMFSTMGQPNWFAAYLAVLLPFALAYLMTRIIQKDEKEENHNNKTKKEFWLLRDIKTYVFSVPFFILLLFYIDNIFTTSKSGYAGLVLGLAVFAGLYFLRILLKYDVKINKQLFSVFRKDLYLRGVFYVLISFFIVNLFLGNPLTNQSVFNLDRIKNIFMGLNAAPSRPTPANVINQAQPANLPPPPQETAGTDSEKIRSLVWRAAFDLFKKYPIIGTGVETFAYSFYQTKPVEHNLTSEWDFIYNKAHNEYLNYLATTGLFGTISYLSIIFLFLYKGAKNILSKKTDLKDAVFGMGIIAAYVSILISNFFGFSVVMINLYLFMIPVIFLGIVDPGQITSFAKNQYPDQSVLSRKNNLKYGKNDENLPIKSITILILAVTAFYMESILVQYWVADNYYALGYNLDKVGEYTKAYDQLTSAYNLRPGEDLFKDELSSNLATISLLFYQQNQKNEALKFAQQAKSLSDETVKNHPKNVIFYKTRTRVLYLLSQEDNKYKNETIQAIETAHSLAPTDAKISYNMGLLYQEQGNTDKAITAFEESINSKINYREPRYALAVLYIQLAKDEQGSNYSLAQDYKKKAAGQLEYSLAYIARDDKAAKSLLDSIR